MKEREGEGERNGERGGEGGSVIERESVYACFRVRAMSRRVCICE